MPKECRFDDAHGEVVVRQEGRRVILEPVDEWTETFRACLGAWRDDIPRPRLAELRYGAELRRSRRLHRLIDAFAEGVEPVLFEQVAAGRFGSVAAALAKAGSPIGELDTMIAAHALALRLTLVTNNARHFDRASGLVTDNWL